MTKLSKYVHLKTSVRSDEDILYILQEAGLTNKNCFHIETLNGGEYSMFAVQTSNERCFGVTTSRSKRIIFTILGNQSEIPIDRDKELKNMKILAEQGLEAKIVAEFENGIAYEE